MVIEAAYEEIIFNQDLNDRKEAAKQRYGVRVFQEDLILNFLILDSAWII